MQRLTAGKGVFMLVARHVLPPRIEASPPRLRIPAAGVRSGLVFLLALALGPLWSGAANAAGARGFQTTGTAASPGVWTITIESFPVFGADPRAYAFFPGALEPQSTASTIVNVPVGTGSTALATNQAITSALNTALYPAKVARTKINRDPSLGTLVTDTGSFTMSISGGVPGQDLAETSPLCCPGATPTGVLVIGGLIMLVGAFRVRGGGA